MKPAGARSFDVGRGHSRGLLAVGLGVIAAGACASATGPGDQLGAVRIALVTVPADVQCLEVTASGTRNVTKRFPLVPGSSATVEMSGLPVGAVQFSANAFAAGCASLTGAAPTWVADPVSATLVGGVVAQVDLVMRRNGLASVHVDFQEDDAGAGGAGGSRPADGGAGAAGAGGAAGGAGGADAGATGPVCGDGIIEPGEDCDPPHGIPGSPAPWCDATCHVPRCGNGIVDPGEACDPPASGWMPGTYLRNYYCGPDCTLIDECVRCNADLAHCPMVLLYYCH